MELKLDVNLQWFPGHMAKTRRLIAENLKLVDVAAEIIDARIPKSSRNPIINELLENKPRIILLNKIDLADAFITSMWKKFYEDQNIPVAVINAQSGVGVNDFLHLARKVMAQKIEKDKSRGMNRPIKAMVVGVPNVGKSSFINRVSKDKKTVVADRPGVTRNKQWIRLKSGLELLDMPGILWPKFDDEQVALNLAFTGAIKDEIYDTETIACKLLEVLSERYRELIIKRYNIDINENMNGYDILCACAKKRGFVQKGAELDTERTAIIILDEFRGGKIGRISLERPT